MADTPRQEPAIHTQDLTRRFKETLAVGRLNLCVRQGEIFGLVGPDGTGKTTTISTNRPPASIPSAAGSSGRF